MFPRVTHPSATPYCYGVRLACVRPAASVRSEPGSNSQVELRLSPDWSLSCPPGSRPAELNRRVPKHIRHLRFSAQAKMAQETCDRRLSHGLEVSLKTRKDNRRPRFSFFRFNCQTADDQRPGVSATVFSARLGVMNSHKTAHPPRVSPTDPKVKGFPNRASVRLASGRSGVYSGLLSHATPVFEFFATFPNRFRNHPGVLVQTL